MKNKLLLAVIFTTMCIATLSAQQADWLFMVEQAVKAPSGHNSQPWLFKLNESSIEVHPNFDKALPAVDPHNRELFISLGCAAQNMRIAAAQKGYATEVLVADSGVVTVAIRRAEGGAASSSLFGCMAKRQTNRSVYSGKRVPADTIAALAALADLFTDAKLYFYENGSPLFDTIARYVAQGNERQMGSKAFTDELKQWMRYNKREDARMNDGLSYAIYGAPSLPKAISKPLIGSFLNAKAQNKSDMKKMASSSHFILFTLTESNPKAWVKLGMCLEHFLLQLTKLGIAVAYLNQPCEEHELAAQMASALGIPQPQKANLLLRIGYGKEQPYSKRRSVDEVLMP